VLKLKQAFDILLPLLPSLFGALVIDPLFITQIHNPMLKKIFG